ncbi:methylesterase 2-like [Macadamia integrifolia]|uniref:methylesterase 2-like n=1 Tax=Macadamia integrifolia TaxID=60698 RepID=UPI001C5308C2|nr:methylesterase 2-like [Macadamia integrifolia]
MAEGQGSKHFVLVHSAGHGEWYWFKVKPLLESAGHKVTTLQLAPSITSWAGVDSINTVHTLSQYSQPLLNLLENLEEKVVLVGHSAGGLSLALAMEKFPDKILVAVFIAAFMPDTSHKPSHVIDEYMKVPMEWKDSYSMSNKGNTTWLFFSDEFLRTRLYQLCSAEDFALVSTLKRPASFFQEDLVKMDPFSAEKYGSVDRVYIVCKEDLAITEDFQHLMINNFGVKEVKVIEHSGHMPMLAKPKELVSHLLDIVTTY